MITITSYYKAAYIALLPSREFPMADAVEITIPLWTKWVAIDKNGFVHAFNDVPHINEENSMWDCPSTTRWVQIAKIDAEFDRWDCLFYAVDAFNYDGENSIRNIILGV